MSQQNAIQTIKLQRERFLAFSFAMADLLIEVEQDGRIGFIAGACRRFFGEDDASLMGQALVDRIAGTSRPLVGQLLRQLDAGRRIPPIEIAIDRVGSGPEKALLCGYALPGHPVKYMTIGAPERFRALLSQNEDRDAESGLHSAESFAERARELIESADDTTGELTMTFMELEGLERLERSVAPQAYKDLISEVAAFLRLQSVGGDSAGRLDQGRFGVITGSGVDASRLASGLAEAVPQARQLTVSTHSQQLHAAGLSPDKASRALIHTLRRFQSEGLSDAVRADPGSQFRDLLQETLKGIEHFQEVIERDRIALAYQPIVSLDDGRLHHYEVLARLHDGASPYEWVTLGESIGMIAAFDLTICRKALADLSDRSAPADLRLAVNLSAQSLQDEVFLDAVEVLLEQYANLRPRLSFEVTESAEIKDFRAVDAAIQRLRGLGCQVGLDDFGAGSASFQYLQAFTIDFVKIDGAYVRAMTDSRRDQALVKGMAAICSDLGVSLIAEMIETDEQVELLKRIGVKFGQGYRFGKPQIGRPTPPPAPAAAATAGAPASRGPSPEALAALRARRRRGASDTWM
ncbi:EAL domain, c-di-GMP-specific phosphodiesterase class I (or its enzymatically inactive variant) [Tistlia consotensis]|uniref:EAL domain, c-di-GMP-specific phosphodiesterase class I (Or its enzymatically inactive variant) n=1 Tax=Tistlia consotensis USBA 355 TaxID=560819 RepID=A0A1Y6CCV5_9PROT|nr:EAL domain-containing protein [Tistlia consotensis]SMF46386.1 EAL domain, c-di-GMP-specific phosphodiesterase class I (or its enzymatically inactive variant) [Tistlia consotensis USBA 355]SNR78485.1 EAL domain, c-di-GMP-specific phosphodiesterase class I (or its enzymatically inactive variant) [Tistlia consotensis]